MLSFNLQVWSIIGPGGRLHPSWFLEHKGHLVLEGLLIVVIAVMLLQSRFNPKATEDDDGLTEKVCCAASLKQQQALTQPTLSHAQRSTLLCSTCTICMQQQHSLLLRQNGLSQLQAGSSPPCCVAFCRKLMLCVRSGSLLPWCQTSAMRTNDLTPQSSAGAHRPLMYITPVFNPQHHTQQHQQQCSWCQQLAAACSRRGSPCPTFAPHVPLVQHWVQSPSAFHNSCMPRLFNSPRHAAQSVRFAYSAGAAGMRTSLRTHFNHVFAAVAAAAGWVRPSM